MTRQAWHPMIMGGWKGRPNEGHSMIEPTSAASLHMSCTYSTGQFYAMHRSTADLGRWGRVSIGPQGRTSPDVESDMWRPMIPLEISREPK